MSILGRKQYLSRLVILLTAGLVLYGFVLLAIVLDKEPPLHPERAIKCERDGVVFFRGYVTVIDEDGKTPFMKLISADNATCRLFEHTEPVK